MDHRGLREPTGYLLHSCWRPGARRDGSWSPLMSCCPADGTPKNAAHPASTGQATFLAHTGAVWADLRPLFEAQRSEHDQRVTPTERGRPRRGTIAEHLLGDRPVRRPMLGRRTGRSPVEAAVR